MEFACLVAPLVPYFISLIALLLLVEQISYIRKKQFVPGPKLVIPFIGSAISLVTNPTKFWDLQSSYAKSSPLGLSANYIIGRYLLYVYSTDLSHKIFTNVRPDAFQLIGHPFGKKLFGEHNIIYMFGQDHKDLRRRIAPNFTPKALQAYTNIQQRIIIKHLASWFDMAHNKSIPLRVLCRDMNLETSQTVFVGPYLNEEACRRFNVDYNIFNVGLLKLPIDLPGFAFRNARLAANRLVETLAGCAELSKKKMKTGGEPTCLIDFWLQENLRESSSDKAFDYSYREIGGHLYDFLFAAQDASTSSLLWAIVFLDSHPDVLEKVRKEVENYWVPENDAVITAEQLREMKYTEAVAREVLRIRAPASLVPHIAAKDFPLTDNYVIPKGTIVFPSVFDSSFQGFTDPERFDPDRFMEREEGRVYKKNFLVFGVGAHQCVGQRYAINHLTVFIALFAMLVEFKRDKTDGCDEIIYVPTITPKDDCRVFLSKKCTRLPTL